MIKLRGKISVQKLTGMVNIVPSGSGGGPLQSKVIYPSHSEQIVKPDDDYYGLSVVTAVAVPKIPICAVRISSDIGNTYGVSVNHFVGVSVTAGKYYTHFLYNGVRLPRIPEDVLKNYPYAWIRNNANSNVYELVYFPNGGYFNGSAVYDKGPVHGPRYQIARNADMDTATWEYVDSTYSGYTIDGNRTVLWSNHDIPNGSATSPNIYFYGSEPVPTD